jgi:hypothetical protein
MGAISSDLVETENSAILTFSCLEFPGDTLAEAPSWIRTLSLPTPRNPSALYGHVPFEPCAWSLRVIYSVVILFHLVQDAVQIDTAAGSYLILSLRSSRSRLSIVAYFIFKLSHSSPFFICGLVYCLTRCFCPCWLSDWPASCQIHQYTSVA